MATITTNKTLNAKVWTERMTDCMDENEFYISAECANHRVPIGTREVKEDTDNLLGIWVSDCKPFPDLKDASSKKRDKLYGELAKRIAEVGGQYEDSGIYPPYENRNMHSGYTVLHWFSGISMSQFRKLFREVFGESIQLSKPWPPSPKKASSAAAAAPSVVSGQLRSPT